MTFDYPTRTAPVALLALVLIGTAGCSGLDAQAPSADLPRAAPTADTAVRDAPVVPGRPARVFIFAGLGDACEPLAPPQITITAAPAQGEVSFRPGQETTIKTSENGTCIGRTAKGTGVYYTARPGASGTDRFSLSAHLASGETAVRSFAVRIAE